MTYLCKIKFFELFFVKKVFIKSDLEKSQGKLRVEKPEELLKLICAKLF